MKAPKIDITQLLRVQTATSKVQKHSWKVKVRKLTEEFWMLYLRNQHAASFLPTFFGSETTQHLRKKFPSWTCALTCTHSSGDLASEIKNEHSFIKEADTQYEAKVKKEQKAISL